MNTCALIYPYRNGDLLRIEKTIFWEVKTTTPQSKLVSTVTICETHVPLLYNDGKLTGHCNN